MSQQKKGRPVINRDLVDAEEKLARINAGLVACYETIAIGSAKKAALEARIAELKKNLSA